MYSFCNFLIGLLKLSQIAPLSTTYNNGGFINVDAFAKLTRLQCSWITWLLVIWWKFPWTKNNTYIPHLTKLLWKLLWKVFVSPTNCYVCSPELPSAFLSQFLWFNSNDKMDDDNILIISFLSFIKMAKLDHGITLYQDTTLTANWNIVEIN